MQVVNASPDAGSINLYLSGNLKNSTPVTYGNSTGYFATIAGNQTAEIKIAAIATTVASTPVNLTPDANYSIFFYGRSATATLSSIVIQDDLLAPSSGKAKVRFVNTVTNYPNVNLQLNSSTALFSNVAYQAVTSFMEITPGNYPLTVVASSAAAVSVAAVSQNFVSGKIYTIYFRGQIGATADALKLGLGVIVNN